MSKRQPYDMVYDREVLRYIAAVPKKHRSLIRREIEAALLHEPDRESRNRKPLLRPTSLGSAWEIRFGPDNRFRVFYKVDPETRRVLVLAMGEKRRNTLLICGKEFDL